MDQMNELEENETLPDLFDLEQDDPRLVKYVKHNLLMKTGKSNGQVSKIFISRMSSNYIPSTESHKKI